MAEVAADSVRPTTRSVRWVLETTLPWVLVIVLAIWFLGAVLQRGLAARPGLAPSDTAQLMALKQRLEFEAGTLPGPQLQRQLEEALALAPAWQAIDLVADDGTVRASTEPTAIGRRTDDSSAHAAARLRLLDGAGRPPGTLVVQTIDQAGAMPAKDGVTLTAWAPTWAVGLPLLLLLAAVASIRAPAPSLPDVALARQRLHATRQRLARAAQEIEWLEARGADEHTGVFTRTGAALRLP